MGTVPGGHKTPGNEGRGAPGNGHGSDKTPTTGNGNGNVKDNNGQAGNDKEHTNNGLHLGQLKNGRENPGQGRDRRSETANLHAQDVYKNPTLTGAMPGQGSSNGSARRAIDSDAPVLITGGEASVEINGDTSGGEVTVDGVTESFPTPVVNGQSEFIWYYHPDHLGSTGFVTDQNGELYEHVEYFPFGETWVQEHSNTQRTPYLYTGKELDEETGLYYYGARYYDPRTSVWVSADPALSRFLPGGKRNADVLPGLGGIYNTRNLSLYNYAGQNPVIFVDPHGEDQFLYFWKPESTGSGAGHVALGIGTQKNQVMYESNPATSAPKAPLVTPYKQTGSMQEVVSKAHNQNRPDLILQLKTSAEQDAATIGKLEEFFAKNKDWKVFSTNCADMSRLGLSATGYDYGSSPIIASPIELAQDLFENNPDAVKSGDIKVISGDWDAVREGTGSVTGVGRRSGILPSPGTPNGSATPYIAP